MHKEKTKNQNIGLFPITSFIITRLQRTVLELLCHKYEDCQACRPLEYKPIIMRDSGEGKKGLENRGYERTPLTPFTARTDHARKNPLMIHLP